MACGWRRRTGLALVAAVLQLPVNAIQFSFCSNVNTGSLYTPDDYSANSLGHCRDDVCKEGGYAFAITQYTQCWCSNFAPTVKTSNSACNRPCPGFPYEMCGSDDGDFSYLQIGTPSGTIGGSSPSSTETSSSSSTTPSPTTTKNIIYQTIVSTIISSNVVIKTTIRTQVVTPTAPVSTQVVTVGGNVVTSFITLTPSQPAGASPDIRETNNSGLSNGAVAGITIGVVLAVAIAAGFVYFCCFRRRRDDDNGENGEGKLGRNTSVLSKAGLLRHTSTRAGPPISTISNRPPRIDTDIPGASAGPSSAATSGGGMLERRDSRPLFRDQRLNPHALMLHPDHSRASLSTLQDNQDYSRPLEVRNPDPLAR